MSATSKRYLWGMLSGAGSVVLRTAVNLAVVPLLIAKLGLDVFSLHILFTSILEIALLLDLGASTALVKLLSGSQSDTERSAYLEVGHILFSAGSLLFLLAGMGLTPWFNGLFHIDSSLTPLVAWGLPLTILEAALSIYACYYQAVLLSHCEHQWTNIADSIYALLSSIGALILLACGGDLTSIVLLRLCCAILRLGIMLFHASRLETGLFRLKLRSLNQKAFSEMAHLCGHALSINLSIIISHKVDAWVIAFFLPLSDVGIYDIVFRMLGITIQICLKMSVGAFPLFSGMASRKATGEARTLFLRLSSLLYFSAGLLTLLILSFYGELFRLFSAGHIPIQETIPVLWLAVPCVLSGVLQLPANSWLFAWGYQPYLTRSSLITSAANLICSIIFVHIFGIAGVALGTLIPQLIQHQAGLIRTTCRRLNISLTEYLKTVHCSVLPPLLAGAGWIQLLRLFVPLSPIHWTLLLPMAAIGASTAIISLALWFPAYASEGEKTWLRGFYTSTVLPLVKRMGVRKTEPSAS
jgi:O-antigen/teichoic acid export membrane protein